MNTHSTKSVIFITSVAIALAVIFVVMLYSFEDVVITKAYLSIIFIIGISVGFILAKVNIIFSDGDKKNLNKIEKNIDIDLKTSTIFSSDMLHFVIKDAQPVTLDFLNNKHPRYSKKMAASVLAWTNVLHTGKLTPKEALVKWLKLYATDLKLSDKDGEPVAQAMTECSTVANWNINGGATKLNGGTTKLNGNYPPESTQVKASSAIFLSHWFTQFFTRIWRFRKIFPITVGPSGNQSKQVTQHCVDLSTDIVAEQKGGQ